MKVLLRRLVPLSLRRVRRDYLMRRQWKDFDALTPKEAFGRIYAERIWGTSDDSPDGFYSGSGGTRQFVATYASSVQAFLQRTFPTKPDVVDLGCGDFIVGSRLRPFAATYTACDVVEPLIRRNRVLFASLDVDFRVLDLTADPLPRGDVAVLRQVLQHLSTAHIQAVVAKIPGTYRYLIVSEHLPADVPWVPNLDKPTGPHTRLDSGRPPSGVVLTAPPFNLTPVRETVLCECRDHLGLIRTTAYELASRG
jgi:hypothetical protein